MIEEKKRRKSGTWLLLDREVAERLGVSTLTLRNWRYKGLGPKFIRLGDLIRYRPQAVREFIRSQEQGGNHGK